MNIHGIQKKLVGKEVRIVVAENLFLAPAQSRTPAMEIPNKKIDEKHPTSSS
jgi:hypothetical protein